MRVLEPQTFIYFAITLLGFSLISSLLLSETHYWKDIDYSTKGYDGIGAVNDAVIQSRTYITPSWLTDEFFTNTTDYKAAQEETAPFVPVATQPVTYSECCKIALSSPNLSGTACRSTCYSEHACENKIFPYSSAEEKKFFYQSRKHWRMEEFRRPWREECARFMSENPPQPTTWCQHTQTQRRQQEMNLTNIPMGCSMVMGMGGMSGPFDRTLLFPAGKLAFCGIPKVGYSSWIQFLRFTIGAKDYQSIPHNKADGKLLHFDRIPPKSQRHILQSDEWTKAVFLRDPAERFLSAYLDKIQNKKKSWRNIKSTTPMNITFADFVDYVGEGNVTCQENMTESSQMGMTWCMDPHWRPQAWSCGLWELLPHFDFVGSIDSADRAARSLLEKVGMWDSYGKHYRKSRPGDKRGGIRGTACRIRPPKNYGSENEFEGFQQLSYGPVSNTSAAIGSGAKRTRFLYESFHRKNSADKMKQYYTEGLLEKVKMLYADDYMLWNALSKSDAGWLSGKKMTTLLNPTYVVN